MATVKSKKVNQSEAKPKRLSVKTGKKYRQGKTIEFDKPSRLTRGSGRQRLSAPSVIVPKVAKYHSVLKCLEVDPAKIPSSTDEEKKELFKILKEAEANGEIDLSEFCVSVEK